MKIWKKAVEGSATGLERGGREGGLFTKAGVERGDCQAVCGVARGGEGAVRVEGGCEGAGEGEPEGAEAAEDDEREGVADDPLLVD